MELTEFEQSLQASMAQSVEETDEPTEESIEATPTTDSLDPFENDLMGIMEQNKADSEASLADAGPADVVAKDADGNDVTINRDIMVRNNEDVGAERKGRIVLGGILEAAADTVEFPFKVVAGAIDEATAMLGRDTSKSGAYPLQDLIDGVIRFDETAEMILPKRQRVPITAADYGLDALARGIGSGVPITGGIIRQGAKTVVTDAANLTAGQQASVAAGKTLRTPTDVLSKTQGVNKAGNVTTTPTLAQRAAADPGTAVAADRLFAGAAGVGASVGAGSVQDGDPEEMKRRAALGELAGLGGAFAAPVVKTLATKGPVGIASRFAWRKTANIRELAVELFDRKAFEGMSVKERLTPSNWKAVIDENAVERYGRKDVLDHLNNFLRTDDVKSQVGSRIRAVEALNKRIAHLKGPDGQPLKYQPGLGALIGTEESKAFQQMTDYHNYEYALQIQHKNQLALEAARKVFAKDPAYKYGDELADMFEMMSKDTEGLLVGMESKMEDVASSLIEQTFANAGTATNEGAMLRKHYENMQDVYTKLRDDMYKLIDIPDNIKFKTDTLSTRMDELLNPAVHDSVAGSRLAILETNLPKALKASEKGMDYKTLDNYRKRIGAEYRTLKYAEPHSPHLKTLSEIQKHIDSIIDKGIDHLPDEYQHVKKARDAARTFFREELQPRFRQGALDDVDSVNVDGAMKISDDSLLQTFWQPGTKTQGSKDFKRLFANADNPDTPYFDGEDLAMLGKEAKNAQESIFRYALGTLQDDLLRAGEAGMKDPTKVLARWKQTYRGALSEFPDVARRLDSTDEVFAAIGEQAQQFQKQRVNLSHNVINKYMRTDPAVVVKKFLSGRREAQATLDLIDSIYATNPKKAIAVRDALEVATMNHILNASVDKITGKMKYGKIADIMADAADTLPLIVGQDELLKLTEFNRSLSVLDSQPALNQQASLNDFAEALKRAGVSPASILSRYYSASLGKVGPIYLGTDAATRILTKKAEIYFQDLYKEIMYNPQTLDDLEDLLQAVGKKGDPKYVDPITQKHRAQAIFSTLGVRIYENDMFDDRNGKDDPMTIRIEKGLPQDEEIMEYNPDTGDLTPYERSTN